MTVKNLDRIGHDKSAMTSTASCGVMLLHGNMLLITASGLGAVAQKSFLRFVARDWLVDF
jgi:hypothetical protein